MSKLIYTVQIKNSRSALLLDIPVVDITVMSGDERFAPTWDNLHAYKNGDIDEDEYTRRYLSKMNGSYETHNAAWNNMLNHDRIALACYCKPGEFCHRHLLTNMLLRIHHRDGEDATYAGELT